MGKYKTHTNNEDSDYEDEVGNHYTPRKKILGEGAMAYARKLDSHTAHAPKLVVLAPLNNNINYSVHKKEAATKYNFFKTLYPGKPIELFQKRSTHRLVVPEIEATPYHLLSKNIRRGKRAQVEIFASAVDAIAHAHSLNLIICDFKEDNAAYHESTKQTLLLDGGSSTQKNEFIPELFTRKTEREVKETRRKFPHVPPECISTERVLATEAMDIYSLGSTMQFLFKNLQPHPQVKDLYTSCIQVEPKKRPTLIDLKTKLQALLKSMDIEPLENPTVAAKPSSSVNNEWKKGAWTSIKNEFLAAVSKKLSTKQIKTLKMALHLLECSLRTEPPEKPLATFTKDCQRITQGKYPKIKGAVLSLSAAVIVFALTFLVGFGIGFALGAWSGPGAFLTGLVAGHMGTMAVVGASTLTGLGIGVLKAYGLFQTSKAIDNARNKMTAETMKLFGPP